MTAKLPFLRLVARKLNVNAKEVANFLEIDKRTLYNYANYSLEQLPLVVKEKFVEFFKTYDEFESEDLTIVNIYDKLMERSVETLSNIGSDFSHISNQKRRLQKDKNVEVLDKRIRSIDLLEELFEGLGIPIDKMNLSKGYIYSLLDVVFSKVKDENDYKLLDYINQYKKEDND